MKNILLISNINIKNPVRGTPIRIHNLAKQIKKKHNLFLGVRDVDQGLRDIFIPYPEDHDRFRKVMYFTRFVKKKNIDTVIVATENSTKLALILKLLTGVKIAIDLHGIRAEEIYFQGKVSLLKKKYMDITTKMYLLFFDLVFVVSKKLKSYFSAFNNNIVVIYGGVDKSQGLSLAEKGQNDNLKSTSVFSVGYTGNARSYQGIEFLLKALRNIHKKRIFDFELKLVLSGTKSSIEKKLNELHLSELTTVYSDLPHDQVYQTLYPVDVLVIPRPSIKMTEFAFPSKTTEYLLTEVPVIMTRVGPVQELFEDQNIAEIIDSKNIADNLEKALIRVYNMSSRDRAKIGGHAREFVEEKLTWDKIGEEINSALERL